MKQDDYSEIYLWNRGVDRLIRVLQRLEAAAILSKLARKTYEVRLEEIRARLNVDFSETTIERERADKARLQRQRMEHEKGETLRLQTKRVM